MLNISTISLSSDVFDDDNDVFWILHLTASTTSQSLLSPGLILPLSVGCEGEVRGVNYRVGTGGIGIL